MAEKPEVKIRLTPEQKQQVQQATGKEIRSLKIEPLESRIAARIAVN